MGCLVGRMVCWLLAWLVAWLIGCMDRWLLGGFRFQWFGKKEREGKKRKGWEKKGRGKKEGRKKKKKGRGKTPMEGWRFFFFLFQQNEFVLCNCFLKRGVVVELLLQQGGISRTPFV